MSSSVSILRRLRDGAPVSRSVLFERLYPEGEEEDFATFENVLEGLAAGGLVCGRPHAGLPLEEGRVRYWADLTITPRGREFLEALEDTEERSGRTIDDLAADERRPHVIRARDPWISWTLLVWPSLLAALLGFFFWRSCG